MKNLKKWMAGLLAIVMLFALSGSVMAASITITNSSEGHTYNAYKIFDVTNSGDEVNGSYAYTITSDSQWFSTVQAYAGVDGNGLELIPVVTTGQTTVVYNVVDKGLDAAKFAAALDVAKSNMDADGTATGNGGAVQISVEDAGYYFVDSTLGALCVLKTSVSKAEIQEKNAEPTLGKGVKNTKDTDAGYTDTTTASIGDVVSYKLTVSLGTEGTLKTGVDADYVITDELPNGVTYSGADSVEVTGLSAGAYTVEYTPATTGTKATLTFTLKKENLAELNHGAEVVITYSATVNGAVEIGTNGDNTNTAVLKYGSRLEYSTAPAQAKVFSYGFDLVKTDANKNVLAGAEFRLYDAKDAGNEIKLIGSEGNYSVNPDQDAAGVVVVAGNVKINGLASGKYYLEEIKAPAGYNRLPARYEVEISAEKNNTISPTVVENNVYSSGGIQIENNKGSILPSTGGMGTTIFYIVGAGLVLVAGVLLITRKRMSAEEK